MTQSEQNALPVAIDDCHQLLAWLVPQLDHFPRNRRYTLGQKLELVIIEVLELLLDATYQKGAGKQHALRQANRKLAVARHLWRLGYELKASSLKAYQHRADQMVILGRQKMAYGAL